MIIVKYDSIKNGKTQEFKVKLIHTQQLKDKGHSPFLFQMDHEGEDSLQELSQKSLKQKFTFTTCKKADTLCD